VGFDWCKNCIQDGVQIRKEEENVTASIIAKTGGDRKRPFCLDQEDVKLTRIALSPSETGKWKNVFKKNG
jgi:hypothetical protein